MGCLTMAADGKPDRIRWQPELGLFSGFSGYAGTIGAALFRIYADQLAGGGHALLGNLLGMPSGPAYGTEGEVKAEAERWLEEFAASLGAVFPDEPRPYAFTRDELVDALTRLEVKVQLAGPIAGMVNAESMADCIIEALGEADRG